MLYLESILEYRTNMHFCCACHTHSFSLFSREDLRVMEINLLVNILLSMIEKATRRTTHCIDPNTNRSHACFDSCRCVKSASSNKTKKNAGLEIETYA